MLGLFLLAFQIVRFIAMSSFVNKSQIPFSAIMATWFGLMFRAPGQPAATRCLRDIGVIVVSGQLSFLEPLVSSL